jgi:hypothetical protein
MRYVLTSVVVGASMWVTGCSMCSPTPEPAPPAAQQAAAPAADPGASPAADPATDPAPAAGSPVSDREKGVLRAQMDRIREDQRQRSAELAWLTAVEAFAPVANDLSRGQVEIALTAQRLERKIQRGDPSMVAYQRKLGRLLGRQHRLLRVAREIAEEQQLTEEVTRIEELEAEYARALVAWSIFDDAFDFAVQDAAEGWATEVDVDADLANVPQQEIYFTFATYFEDEQQAQYAGLYGFELPPDEEMTRWETWSGDELEGSMLELTLVALDPATLEAQHGLEEPEYYDDLVAVDEEVPADLEARFDELDEQVDTIIDTEPDELEEQYDAYFEDEEATDQDATEEADEESEEEAAE